MLGSISTQRTGLAGGLREPQDRPERQVEGRPRHTVPDPNRWARTSEFLGFRKNTRQLTPRQVWEGSRDRTQWHSEARHGACMLWGGGAAHPLPEAVQPDGHGARDQKAEETTRPRKSGTISCVSFRDSIVSVGIKPSRSVLAVVCGSHPSFQG